VTTNTPPAAIRNSDLRISSPIRCAQVECAREMEHFDPYETPACGQPLPSLPLSVSRLL
jgi:hypothetical protein